MFRSWNAALNRCLSRRRRRDTRRMQAAQRNLGLEALETRALLSATEITIGEPELLSGGVNTQDRERSASVSGDGLALYFQRSESFALNGNLNVPINTELMVSVRPNTGAPWGPAAPLGAPLSSAHPETWPDVSADGGTLYFSDVSDPPASDDPRPGGEGLGDLWVSTKDGANQWQAPVNLGPTVNSSARDASPELSSDGLTLFFASDRPGGSGVTDLWMTTRTSHTDPWQTPTNLGSTLNSIYEDVHPSISPDGLALAFSSNRAASGADSWDIWIATRSSLQDPFGAPVSLRAQLPAGFQGTHGPEFSADGSTLYFSSRGFSLSNSFDLWEVPIAIEQVVFEDSFEDGQWNGKWVVDGQADWQTSSQRATVGSFSAEVDGRANDATLTMATSLDLSGYERAEVRFDWLIESTFDTGEYVAVDVSTNGGNSWQPLDQLNGNVDAENQWHAAAIEITDPSSNTLVRFRGTANRSNEDANVDNVRIVVGGTATPVPPVFAIDDVTVTEADSGTTTASFTVTRSGDTSQAASVDFSTTDGTALAGSDYVSLSGTLTFAPSEASKAIDVAVIGDIVEELDESFYVDLSNAPGATIDDSRGVATIVDNDAVAQAVEVYIFDIRAESKRRGRDWRAVVEVRAVGDDSPVAGVRLKVDFYGTIYEVETDANGIARTPWLRNASGAHLANAYDVALGDSTFAWTPLAFDLEDDDDGDGNPDDLLILG